LSYLVGVQFAKFPQLTMTRGAGM